MLKIKPSLVPGKSAWTCSLVIPLGET
jgi:hypothetical protein